MLADGNFVFGLSLVNGCRSLGDSGSLRLLFRSLSVQCSRPRFEQSTLLGQLTFAFVERKFLFRNRLLALAQCGRRGGQLCNRRLLFTLLRLEFDPTFLKGRLLRGEFSLSGFVPGLTPGQFDLGLINGFDGKLVRLLGLNQCRLPRFQLYADRIECGLRIPQRLTRRFELRLLDLEVRLLIRESRELLLMKAHRLLDLSTLLGQRFTLVGQ